jgi:8-oxo-dGTP pyrophosphatase MutT (NUDIX family)|tara:strand:- start:52 stop:522 length:471 start_codon:yes stop_codon:yes gene_type:complete
MSKKIKYAPRDIFEQILEWTVIPTFDLIIEYSDKGIIVVKRKIAPYNNQWALPGLRMFKNEDINDTLVRIAKQELGFNINPKNKKFLGQYVGNFKTENNRQDLSTGYYIKIISNKKIKLNKDHFSSIKFIKSKKDIPLKIGAMYKFYLRKYFDLKK